jgi:hypothetical protein
VKRQLSVPAPARPPRPGPRTLAPNPLTDVVAVAVDPLQNVYSLETATVVMKNSLVYEEPARRRQGPAITSEALSRSPGLFRSAGFSSE